MPYAHPTEVEVMPPDTPRRAYKRRWLALRRRVDVAVSIVHTHAHARQLTLANFAAWEVDPSLLPKRPPGR